MVVLACLTVPNFQDREKKEKEQHAKERVQKNNKEKSRVAGVEAQQKAQQKKDKDNALKALNKILAHARP